MQEGANRGTTAEQSFRDVFDSVNLKRHKYTEESRYKTHKLIADSYYDATLKGQGVERHKSVIGRVRDFQDMGYDCLDAFLATGAEKLSVLRMPPSSSHSFALLFMVWWMKERTRRGGKSWNGYRCGEKYAFPPCRPEPSSDASPRTCRPVPPVPHRQGRSPSRTASLTGCSARTASETSWMRKPAPWPHMRCGRIWQKRGWNEDTPQEIRGWHGDDEGWRKAGGAPHEHLQHGFLPWRPEWIPHQRYPLLSPVSWVAML